MRKNILITGGSGFIGSHLVNKIQGTDKYNIIIYDIKDYDCQLENVNFINGDILDLKKLVEHTNNIDIIIHCAAICGINKIKENPKLTLHVNYKGTENILKCAKQNNIKNLILFSTSEIYGKYCIGYDELESVRVERICDNQRSIYQISKLLDETVSWLYHNELNNNITIIRPFKIYGPGQIGDGAIKNFVINALQNKDININGDGSILRSWCYVEDIVNYVEKCLDRFDGYKIYNIGNNDILSIKQLALKIIKLCNSESKIIYKEKMNDDVLIRFPNVSQAETDLDYSCKVSLDDGIKKTIDYFRKKI